VSRGVVMASVGNRMMPWWLMVTGFGCGFLCRLFLELETLDLMEYRYDMNTTLQRHQNAHDKKRVM
jgi:hypothetical protein